MVVIKNRVRRTARTDGSRTYSPKPADHDFSLLAWLPDDFAAGAAWDYAQALSNLINARLYLLEETEVDANGCATLIDHVNRTQADLLVYCLPGPPFPEEQGRAAIIDRVLEQLPVSVMLLKQPRWPLKKILLVLKNDEMDGQAIAWAICLARHSGASVNVLAITTPVPAMYSRDPRMQYSLPALLSSDCAFGRRLRTVAHQLVDYEIQGTLRLREETPDWQIRCEVDEGDCDLIVIAAQFHGRLRRWLLADLVRPLLDWVDRPVLVAREMRTGRGGI